MDTTTVFLDKKLADIKTICVIAMEGRDEGKEEGEKQSRKRGVFLANSELKTPT